MLSDRTHRKVVSDSRQEVSVMQSVTWSLFERWKKVKALTSDRQACMALGLSHGATVYWKQGKNATADVLERMARDLGHSDQEIAALMFEAMAESQTANADAARTLHRMAKKVSALSLVGLAVVASLMTSTTQASTASSSCNQRTLNIMSVLRALFGSRLAAA
jgi:hypothetical protein